MREFETVFVVQPEISEAACQEICTRLDSILEKQGARRVMLDDWGKRKLAYEISHFQKGHYFVLYYLDGGEVVDELERVLRLEESVLRYLTVRAVDQVADPDARVALGAEQERIQREKAAERAARDAEIEEAARQAAAVAAAEAAARASQAAEASAKASAEASAGESAEPAEAAETAGAEETSETPETTPEAAPAADEDASRPEEG